MDQNHKKQFLRKIFLPFVIGVIFLSSGLLLFEFGGHRNHTKAFLLMLPGVILTGAFGIGIIQYIRFLKDKK